MAATERRTGTACDRFRPEAAGGPRIGPLRDPRRHAEGRRRIKGAADNSCIPFRRMPTIVSPEIASPPPGGTSSWGYAADSSKGHRYR